MRKLEVDRGREGDYIIIHPQPKNNLTMNIPTLQSAYEMISRGSEDGGEEVGRGEDLLFRSVSLLSPAKLPVEHIRNDWMGGWVNGEDMERARRSAYSARINESIFEIRVPF